MSVDSTLFNRLNQLNIEKQTAGWKAVELDCHLQPVKGNLTFVDENEF